MELFQEKGKAVGVCTFMAFGYVALLYAPELCLPQPKSAQEHMLRRFACAGVASLAAPFVSVSLLPVDTPLDLNGVALLKMFGVSYTHLWQAAFIPTLLTSILYLGPLLLDFLDLFAWCVDDIRISGRLSFLIEHMWTAMVDHGKILTSDVMWWRNFVMAPISEEVVFRVCMVPVLLCGGFSPSAVVFICPMFFALAHVHHVWELIYVQGRKASTAVMIIGMQLGYTTLFGWYATYLYLRTGHVISPLVAHMFCNTMGLPDVEAALASPHQREILVAYAIGLVGFFMLLGPMSNPSLYNDASTTAERCSCWLGYCKWGSSANPGQPYSH